MKLLLISKQPLQLGKQSPKLFLCLLPIYFKHFLLQALFKFPDFSRELSIEARGNPRWLLFLGKCEGVYRRSDEILSCVSAFPPLDSVHSHFIPEVNHLRWWIYVCVSIYVYSVLYFTVDKLQFEPPLRKETEARDEMVTVTLKHFHVKIGENLEWDIF